MQESRLGHLHHLGAIPEALSPSFSQSQQVLAAGLESEAHVALLVIREAGSRPLSVTTCRKRRGLKLGQSGRERTSARTLSAVCEILARRIFQCCE
jgi:hypothetical protein